jgi:hypothetical protein
LPIYERLLWREFPQLLVLVVIIDIVPHLDELLQPENIRYVSMITKSAHPLLRVCRNTREAAGTNIVSNSKL